MSLNLACDDVLEIFLSNIGQKISALINERYETTFQLLVFQEAQSYADDNSLLFMETSAKTAMNVNEIFMAIGTY